MSFPERLKSRKLRMILSVVVFIAALWTFAGLCAGCHLEPGLWHKDNTVTIEKTAWAISPQPTPGQRDTLAELARVAAEPAMPAAARDAAALELQRFVGGTPTGDATDEATAKQVVAEAQAHRKDLLKRTAQFQAQVKASGGTVVSAGPSGEIDVIGPTVVTRVQVRDRLIDKLMGFPIGVLVLIPAAAMFGLAIAGGIKRWEWAVGAGVGLGCVFGAIGAMLLAWELLDAMPGWVWIVIVAGGALTGIAAALVVRVRKRTAALKEVVSGVEQLKVAEDLSDDAANKVLKGPQSPATREQVDAILGIERDRESFDTALARIEAELARATAEPAALRARRNRRARP